MNHLSLDQSDLVPGHDTCWYLESPAGDPVTLPSSPSLLPSLVHYWDWLHLRCPPPPPPSTPPSHCIVDYFIKSIHVTETDG